MSNKEAIKMEELTKVCTKCGIEKPLSEFYKQRGGKFSVYSICKLCSSKQCKEYRAANRDKLLVKQKEYRENNRELINKKAKQYRKDNIELILKREKKYREENRDLYNYKTKVWRENNKEYVLKYNKRYCKENKDAIAERRKKYYEANKDKLLKQTKEWYKNNKDKRCAYEAKRNALKLKQTPQLTKEEQATINLYYKLSQAMSENYHIDHVTPLDKGGLHCPDNLQILHVNDNLSKQAKLKYKYKHPRYRIINNQLVKVVK